MKRGTSLLTLLYENQVPISSVFVRREVLDCFGGFSQDSRVGSAEDYEFLLRYAFKHKFFFLDKYLIRYRASGVRMTKEDTDMQCRDALKYFLQIINCYSIFNKTHHVFLYSFVFPVVYHFKNFIKTCGFVLLRKAKKMF